MSGLTEIVRSNCGKSAVKPRQDWVMKRFRRENAERWQYRAARGLQWQQKEANFRGSMHGYGCGCQWYRFAGFYRGNARDYPRLNARRKARQVPVKSPVISTG